jgi:hypothetical protein
MWLQQLYWLFKFFKFLLSAVVPWLYVYLVITHRFY